MQIKGQTEDISSSAVGVKLEAAECKSSFPQQLLLVSTKAAFLSVRLVEDRMWRAVQSVLHECEMRHSSSFLSLPV